MSDVKIAEIVVVTEQGVASYFLDRKTSVNGEYVLVTGIEHLDEGKPDGVKSNYRIYCEDGSTIDIANCPVTVSRVLKGGGE